MFNPILSNTPYSITTVFPESKLGEKDEQAFEDILDDTNVFESNTMSDFDIKIIADRISSKLVKLVEQQLQEQVQE